MRSVSVFRVSRTNHDNLKPTFVERDRVFINLLGRIVSPINLYFPMLKSWLDELQVV